MSGSNNQQYIYVLVIHYCSMTLITGLHDSLIAYRFGRMKPSKSRMEEMIPLGRCVDHFPFPCLRCLINDSVEYLNIELYHFNRMGVPEECAGAVSYIYISFW